MKMARSRETDFVKLCILVLTIVSRSKAMNLFEKGTQMVANCYMMPENYCPYQDVTLWYFNNHIAATGGYMVTQMNMYSLPIIQGAPWVIIFHGFSCSKDTTPNIELRPAYFQRGYYNILSADVHKPLASGPLKVICYPSAARNIYYIGRCFAGLLAMLIQGGVIPPPHQLHFVGHSLGAHIAGNTATELRNVGMGTVLRVTGTLVPHIIITQLDDGPESQPHVVRIVDGPPSRYSLRSTLLNCSDRTGTIAFNPLKTIGLDPAGPLLWRSKTPSYKILDPTDATMVDAHHTSGGDWYAKGQTSPVGTVDIYYNGGMQQPNCDETAGCSHHRVVEYYAESIYPLPPLYNRFYSMSPFLVLVGEDMQLNTRGIFYVTTREYRPYALGLNPQGSMPLMPMPMIMGRDQSFLDSRNVTRATDLERRDTRLLDRARDITNGRNLSKRANMMGLRRDSNFNEF